MEAGVEVVVIEVVGVGVGAEVGEVDTALHPGARSGNPQVPTPFLWDRSRFLSRLLTFVVRILRCRLPNASFTHPGSHQTNTPQSRGTTHESLTPNIHSLHRTTAWTTLPGLSDRQVRSTLFPSLIWSVTPLIFFIAISFRLANYDYMHVSHS